MAENIDLSVENIKKLNEKCQKQDKHLYEFLKEEYPEISTEDRLKYLATVLNDHFDDYEFDEKAERHKEDGYSIVKFWPKGNKK
jgi:DNA-binding transcriptional regulator GbsR (MarR family)